MVDALCPVITRRQNQLALVRRPSGFGKTTFLSTSEFIHDVLNERAVAHAFGPRPSSFSYFRGDRLVLPVDLQGVFYDTSENMCSSANAYLNSIYRSFLRQYAEQLDLFDEDEILSYVHPTSKDTFDEILVSAYMLQWRSLLTMSLDTPHVFGPQTDSPHRQLQLAAIEVHPRELHRYQSCRLGLYQPAFPHRR